MTESSNRSADEALVRFARRLTHDLNNYTTIVSTYSELLLADLDPSLPAHADIQEIYTAAEGMVRYLARVTRFARAGSMKRVPTPVDAGVHQAVELFRVAHPDREVAVAGASGATVQADPVWWRDVVGELLQNAHEAAPAGTPIRVVLSRPAPELVIVTVEDDGPGFDPEIEAIACDPLVTTREGIRGAGMGLTLAAAFAEACGGRIVCGRDGGKTAVSVALGAESASD